jgi:hypothetical protein
MCVAYEVEGAVEADVWRLRALLAVMPKAAHKRVGRTEAECAHPTIDGYDNGRFDFLDQVGLVIPLRGIGGTAARRGMLIDEKQAHEFFVLQPCNVNDGANSGAKVGTGLGNRKGADVALDELRLHHVPASG